MVAEKLSASPKLSITVHKVESVLPTKSRPDEVYELTNLDQNVATVVKTISLFPAKEGVTADPVAVFKNSLAKLLDYYYPLAGRLGLTADGKLNVNYSSQGVVFAEASTTAQLVDLGDISKPADHLHALVYTDPHATNLLQTPLVTAQVTKFKCGGFVFGLANQHSMFDGIGAIDFMRTWSEVARGVPLTTVPYLDRSVLRNRSPPQIDFPHIEFSDIQDVSKNGSLAITDVVHNSFFFTSEELEALKKKLMVEGGFRNCTTFQALSALIWRSRTMALKMEPEQKTRLYFAVDGRSKIVPPLPKGYVGNAIVLVAAMTTSADLCGKPLHHAVKLVQKAISVVDDKFVRLAIDYYEATRARPSMVGSMILTTWARLPFECTDFGWGEPSQSGPVALPEPHIVLLVSHGKDRKGINVLAGLPKKCMDTFQQLMKHM